MTQFFIPGAQRSGTSTLVRLLDSHPQILMARPFWPEPKYFLNHQDKEAYQDKYFSGAKGHLALGEKSTSYMDHPQCLSPIKKAFPKARFIFLLRHPVDRALSNYFFTRAHKLEPLDLEQALAQEEERLSQGPVENISTSPFAYGSRGRYFSLLKPFLEAFDKDQIHIGLTSDLQEDPASFCKDAYSFLGVDPSHQPHPLRVRINAASPAKVSLSQRAFARLLESLEPEICSLEALICRDLSSWRQPSPLIQLLP